MDIGNKCKDVKITPFAKQTSILTLKSDQISTKYLRFDEIAKSRVLKIEMFWICKS